MNTNSRLKIYLVLILLTGVGLALTVPILAQAHASTSSDTLAPSAADDIIYVAKSGDGSDGLSWETAYTDLQTALAEAVSGHQIWVARGVYIPGINRTDSFHLVPGVALYGGFDPAAGADQFNERDWGAYPTILSGDIGGDDIKTDGVVLTTTHIAGGNSYHVVRADGTSTPITGSTLLDGFTITAGQADGIFPYDRGGGFDCEGNGGGAECSPSLRNLIFSGNAAGCCGGAMYNHGYQGSSSPALINVTFYGNAAGAGGAMNNNGESGNSNPSLREVTFSGNSADYGGAMYNYGYDGVSSPSLANVTFAGNAAGQRGGAMFNDGSDAGSSSPTLTNVTFSGNSAGSGGAMYNDGSVSGTSSPSLNNATFSGNSAEWDGGAMFNWGFQGTSSPTLTNVTFSGNWASIQGGAMYNYHSSPNVRNSILWKNQDSSGTGTISATIYNEYDSIVTLTHSLAQGTGGSDSWTSNGSIVDGGGNLDDDPDFILDLDPSTAPTTTGNLRLQADSPAIDTGNNTFVSSLSTDLDGNPRVIDGNLDGTATVDMGAYEYNCPAGGVLYVNHSASGAGSSWLDAKPDLALGLHLAGHCPDVSQVWVATGVYTPGVQRSDSFDLVPGVALYGGFYPAAGADQFNERDWGAYPTILSGDIGDDDVQTNGVVLTTADIVGGNSYHVVTADGTSTPITGTTVLDGFTITAGQANGDYSDNNHAGGGYYCDGSGVGAECSSSLRNLTFSGNYAYYGGAMFNDGASSPSLSNVTFTGNSAGSMGGAMFNWGFQGTSSPTLTNVTFSGNAADYGGAMFNDGHIGDSKPSLSNVILWGNTAVISGSQIYNEYASVTITTSLVQGGINGSGVYNQDSTVNDGGGNLDADPDFVRDPDPGPDGSWDGVDDDYGDLHLGAGSPADDSGTNSAISLPTDLDGNPRVIDGDGDGTATVDMGAYEFQLLDLYIPLVFR